MREDGGGPKSCQSEYADQLALFRFGSVGLLLRCLSILSLSVSYGDFIGVKNSSHFSYFTGMVANGEGNMESQSIFRTSIQAANEKWIPSP